MSVLYRDVIFGMVSTAVTLISEALSWAGSLPSNPQSPSCVPSYWLQRWHAEKTLTLPSWKHQVNSCHSRIFYVLVIFYFHILFSIFMSFEKKSNLLSVFPSKHLLSCFLKQRKIRSWRKQRTLVDTHSLCQLQPPPPVQ